MYEEGACFDPNSMQEGVAENGFSQTMPNSSTAGFSMEELPYHPNPYQEDQTASEAANGVAAAAAAMDVELQQQLGRLDMEHCYNTNPNNHCSDTHLMQQEVGNDSNHQVLSYDHHHHHQSNWDTSNVQEMQDMSYTQHNPHHQDQQHLQQHVDQLHQHHHHHQHQHGGFNSSSLPDTPYPPTPDLLNLLHLPRSTLLPNSSISFANPGDPKSTLGFLGDLPAADNASVSNVLFDPLLHLNLPPQPPLFRELFQSLPHDYNLRASRGYPLFGGVDEREANGGGVYQDAADGRQFDNGVVVFSRDMNCMSKERNNGTKHFATERQRRDHLNQKYKALRSLVPNPTKIDRASVVGEAIDYIKELIRTVNELKILVEKKRCVRDRSKRHKTEDAGSGDVESCNIKPTGGDQDQSYSGSSLRSSWLQRKSKNTEVDVRIIDDEVTIKVIQQKRINCLMFVSKVLDELQLDLHHVAGGHIGDYYSYLFNTKLCEGSSVYASAIANKLIEVVDRQYAAIPPTSSY
ncbi:transcription factor bHLH91-like [Cornus florida]|uniref:transcription factor bHLH91-like n=1 Tax=Cornus florida TaxID=4283 RepID=UPI0028A0FD7C|nr:transcription factor bHLH91-like [Cornus florida]